MPSLSDYNIEVEWLVTWFGSHGKPNLAQQTRAGSHRFNTETLANPGPGGGTGAGLNLPVAFRTPEDDPLLPQGLAGRGGAQILLRLDESRNVTVNIDVSLGSANREKTFTVPPKAKMPYMISVTGGGEEDLRGTTLCLHGTITTGGRPIDDIIRQGISELTRTKTLADFLRS